MQIAPLAWGRAQCSNGNLPSCYRFSLEMRLLVSQSTQPHGKGSKGSQWVLHSSLQPRQPLSKVKQMGILKAGELRLG